MIAHNRLHIVEWVLLIEWQTKVALIFHLWSWYMLLDSVWLILSWANIDSRIACQHVGVLNETLLVGCEDLILLNTMESNKLIHFIL